VLLIEYPIIWNGNKYTKLNEVYIPVLNEFIDNENKKKAYNFISQISNKRVPDFEESIIFENNIWTNDPRIEYKSIEDCVKFIEPTITYLSSIIIDFICILPA